MLILISFASALRRKLKLVASLQTLCSESSRNASLLFIARRKFHLTQKANKLCNVHLSGLDSGSMEEKRQRFTLHAFEGEAHAAKKKFNHQSTDSGCDTNSLSPCVIVLNRIRRGKNTHFKIDSHTEAVLLGERNFLCNRIRMTDRAIN